jgi:two-component system response regulator PilR (NtrC family)
MITPESLPPNLAHPAATGPDIPLEVPDDGLNLEAMIDRLERQYIQQALHRTGGNQTRAAALLGLSFRQLRYKVRKHGLQTDHLPQARDSAASTVPD